MASPRSGSSEEIGQPANREATPSAAPCSKPSVTLHCSSPATVITPKTTFRLSAVPISAPGAPGCVRVPRFRDHGQRRPWSASPAWPAPRSLRAGMVHPAARSGRLPTMVFSPFRSRWGSTGLRRMASARESFMAAVRSSVSVSAVIRTEGGQCSWDDRSRRRNSIPFIRGMLMSTKTMSVVSGSYLSRASTPSAASVNSNAASPVAGERLDDDLSGNRAIIDDQGSDGSRHLFPRSFATQPGQAGARSQHRDHQTETTSALHRGL